MKKFLLVIYSFPPSSHVHSLRFYKLMRHINKCGWEPFILTRKVSSDEERYDDNLLKGLPENTQIVRISCIDLKKYAKCLMGFAWFFHFDGEFFSNPPKSMLLTISSIFIANPLIWFSKHFSRFIDVFPPDSMIGWIPFLYQTAKKIISQEKIDLVMTYSTPQSNSIHLAGNCIKRKFHLPWVVCYDDEWSQHPWRNPLFKWQKRLDRWLERKILLAASRVIASTPSYSTLYSQLVPQDMAGKFDAITYSYDENDFKYKKKVHSQNYIHFTYTGSLYGDQTPLYFLKAVKQLVENGLLPVEKVRVTFAGMVEHKLQPLFQDTILKPIINYRGVCSFRDSLKYIQNADVLILIVSSTRGEGNIPAKTFEYIGSGKPILALVPNDGDAAEIIKRAGTGIIIEPDNVGAIKQAVMDLYTKWTQGELKIEPNWKEIRKHEAREVTKNLCTVFNSLAPELRRGNRL